VIQLEQRVVPLYAMKPPNHPLNKSFDNVHRCYAIPLPAKDILFSSNATGFGDIVCTQSCDNYMLKELFHLFLVIVQNPYLGTPSGIMGPAAINSSCEDYDQRVIEAMVTLGVENMPKRKKELIFKYYKKHVHGHYFSHEAANKMRAYLQSMGIVDSVVMDMDGAVGNQKLEDSIDTNIDAGYHSLSLPDEDFNNYMRQGEADTAFTTNEAESEEADSLIVETLMDDQEEHGPLRMYGPEEELSSNSLMQKMQEKVSVIFQHFEDEHKNFVGAVMFILQHDPHWNAGRGVEDILRIAKNSQQRKFMNKNKRNMEMDPRDEIYDYLPEDHPVFHLTYERYANTCGWMIGNEQYVIENLHKAKDATIALRNYDNPFHPCKIFDPQYALSMMRSLGAKKELCDIKNYMGSGEVRYNKVQQKWSFPFPRRAYLFPVTNLNYYPDIYGRPGLADQYFPWSAAAQLEACQKREYLAGISMKSCLRPHYKNDVLIASGLLSNRYSSKDEYSNIDELYLMEQKFQPMLQAVLSMLPQDPETSPEEYAAFCEKYADHEEKVSMTFNHIWHRENMHISRALRIIIGWVQMEKPHTYTQHAVIVDKDMDEFANRLAYEGMRCFSYLTLSPTVKDFILLRYGWILDAYRPGFDLHLNISLLGQHGVSKSDTVKKVIAGTIEGSVEDIDDSTNRADNTDEKDRCDMPTYYDEAPSFISGTSDSKDDRIARQKAKLTSGRMKMRVYAEEELPSGRRIRKSRIVETWLVGTVAFCSNARMANADPALMNRFYHSQIPKSQLDGYTIPDLMGSEKSAEDKNYINGMNRFYKKEQYLWAITNKFIQVKGLPEPNMNTANLLLRRMLGHMRDRWHIDKTDDPRHYERTIRLAYCFTIANAIHRVCNMPGGEIYFKPFTNIEFIRAVKPHLVCTKQIIIFAFTILGDQWTNSASNDMVSALLKAAGYPIDDSSITTLPRHEIYNRERRILWRQIAQRRTDIRCDKSNVSGPDEPSCYATGGGSTRKFDAKVESLILDLNYVAIPEKWFVAVEQSRCTMNPEPSKNNAYSIVRSLMGEYALVNQHGGIDLEEIPSGYIAAPPIQKRNVRLPIIIPGKHPVTGKDETYILIDALKCNSKTILMDAVRRCTYKGWKKQKFLLGIPKTKSPFLFKTITIEPNERQERFSVYNPMYMSKKTRYVLNFAPPDMDAHIEKALKESSKEKEEESDDRQVIVTNSNRDTTVYNENRPVLFIPRIKKFIQQKMQTDFKTIESNIPESRKNALIQMKDDLDVIAFKQHWYRCGLPLEGMKDGLPTSDNIKERMISYFNEHPKMLEKYEKCLGDYPKSIRNDIKAGIGKWRTYNEDVCGDHDNKNESQQTTTTSSKSHNDMDVYYEEVSEEEDSDNSSGGGILDSFLQQQNANSTSAGTKRILPSTKKEMLQQKKHRTT